MKALTRTDLNLPGQVSVYHGKVRDVYNINDDLMVMVATDRISAFDVILPKGIPFKGQVLNQIAANFLDATSDIVPNWKLATPDPMVTVGLKAEGFRVEMIIRGYLTGSAWREYKNGCRELCGVKLPDGMRENERFPEPIITPTTKAEEGHDENISKEEIIAQGIVSREDYEVMEQYTRALFQRGTEIAAKKGLILVDTKYEFGKRNGKVILIQHENYSVESDKISMYSDAPETTIWSGNFVIGNWNAGMQDLAWGGYDWSTAVAGQVLTIYLKPDMSEGWSQIRVGNGSWAALPGTSDVNPLTGEDTKFSVTLTQAMIDEMVANGGLVICGAFFTVSKITLSLLENVLWQGQAVVDDWGNQPYILSDGGPELLAAGMKVGSVIRCYLTPTDATWNCQVWDGHWGAQFDDCDFSSGNWNLAEHEGAIEFKVTDAIYKSITSAGGWGGAFLLNGDNCICTKVSIK